MNLNIELLKTITILYAEDDHDIIDSTVPMFNKILKKTIVANNGEEGCELFKQHKDEIDIIVSDINMPIKNGLSMIEDILKIHYVPTILLTAYTDKTYLLNSIDLGIDKYMSKPIKIKELISNIEELVLENRKKKHIKNATKTLVVKSKEINEEKKNLIVQVENSTKELRLLRTLADTYICTIQTDKHGIILDGSTKFFNLYEYTKDEIIGQNISKLVDEDYTGTKIQKHMLEAIHGKKSINSTHKFRTKNGQKLKCNMIMTPHFGENGYANGYTFYQDLTYLG